MKNQEILTDTFFINAFDKGYELIDTDNSKFKVKMTPSQADKVRLTLRYCTFGDETIKLKVAIEKIGKLKVKTFLK